MPGFTLSGWGYKQRERRAAESAWRFSGPRRQRRGWRRATPSLCHDKQRSSSSRPRTGAAVRKRMTSLLSSRGSTAGAGCCFGRFGGGTRARRLPSRPRSAGEAAHDPGGIWLGPLAVAGPAVRPWNRDGLRCRCWLLSGVGV